MADRARRVDGSTDTEVRPTEQPAIEEPRTGRLRFPSALTVLALILVAMWVASFFITKGLQETVHDFRALDEEVQLRPILDQLAALPPLDRPLSDGAQARLPEVVGGLSLALARSFTILDPSLKNPSSEQWEGVFRIFDLLV
jgi:hypothetical protein